MRPGGDLGRDRGSAKTDPYDILYEEYIEGMPTKAVMRRHSISESTLHRYGRDATLALARELEERERVLAEPSGIGRTPKR
jgi:hypothetical protein